MRTEDTRPDELPDSQKAYRQSPGIAELVGYAVLVALAVLVRVQHAPVWLGVPLVAVVLLWHQIALRVFPPRR